MAGWTRVHSGFANKEAAHKSAEARRKLFPHKDARVVKVAIGRGYYKYAIESRDKR